MHTFNDHLDLDSRLKIDNVSMPHTTEAPIVEYEPISDIGRLADDPTAEGRLIGLKRKITLKWAYLTKAHYDAIFNATIGKLINNSNIWFSVSVPTYTPEGTITMNAYLGASNLNNSLYFTTERYGDEDSAYLQGGAYYDELHKDVQITFIEK